MIRYDWVGEGMEDMGVSQTDEYKCDFDHNPRVLDVFNVVAPKVEDGPGGDMFDGAFLFLGICCVDLNINGIKTRVVVDDFLPCIDSVPIYAQNETHALWVSMLEKALAKVKGSYKNISEEVLESSDELVAYVS